MLRQSSVLVFLEMWGRTICQLVFLLLLSFYLFSRVATVVSGINSCSIVSYSSTANSLPSLSAASVPSVCFHPTKVILMKLHAHCKCNHAMFDPRLWVLSFHTMRSEPDSITGGGEIYSIHLNTARWERKWLPIDF